ncbi:MAG: hypothetical protein ACM33T_04265 [Solirubrobacterales bacterium]
MRAAALLMLALALAACGELPQPFRHEGPLPPLARPKFGRGVTIRPSEGVPDAAARADALVKALELLEIPATVRSGPSFGHVVDAEPAEESGVPGLRWTLRAPDGQASAIAFQRVSPTAGASRDALKRQAGELAAALARHFDDPDAQAPHGAPAPRRAGVRLVPFATLPGDGNRSLTRATREALERSGVLVVEEGGDYIVEGRVTILPGAPGEENLVLAWTVKGGDGQEIATVDQQGAVRKGQLSGAWGPLARDIAEGGAAGVLEVVREAARPARP